MFILLRLFFIANIIVVSHVCYANEPVKKQCPDFPYFKPYSGSYAELNCQFHHAYEARVRDIIQSFGVPHGRPVILNLGGKLVLKYNGDVKEIELLSPTVQSLKSLSHSIFSVFLILAQDKSYQLNNATKKQLSQLLSILKKTQPIVVDLKISAKEKVAVSKAISLTTLYLKSILSSNHWSNSQLISYYEQMRLPLNLLLEISSQSIIDKLDEAILPWINRMNDAERRNIAIVVACSHQARAREISIQYFSKLFDKRVGEGAEHEKGLVVLEGKFDEPAALVLLARHYLDRQAAGIIFNSPEFLQSDIMANTAKKILAKRRA